MEYRFTSLVSIYNTENGAWHFACLPRDVAQSIKYMTGGNIPRRGFGSVRVAVAVQPKNSAHLGGQAIMWKTSIFPDSKTNSYLLPIKNAVRKQAQIHHGDEVEFVLNIDV